MQNEKEYYSSIITYTIDAKTNKYSSFEIGYE